MILSLGLLLQPGREVARGGQETSWLEPGKPVERDLEGGQSHAYHITLSAGQYLHVIIDQRGIDVVAVVFGPDGKKLDEIDSPNGTQGPEPISLVAETAGAYRFEVRALEKGAAAGRYEVRLAELRPATAPDRSRVAAVRTAARGDQLRAARTAAALRGAAEKYAAALPLWRAAGDRQGEARTLLHLGGVYYELQEMPPALDHLNQALVLFREVGDLAGQSDALNNLGAAHSFLGEKRKALAYYEQALPIDHALGDREGEATITSNIGLIYDALGEPRKALDYHQRALTLGHGSGDQQGEAIRLSNIGLAYDALGESQRALDHYRRALPLHHAAGDRKGEATTLSNIAAVYGDLAEWQQALDFNHQALALRRAIGDRKGQATSLNNLGGLYYLLGEPRQALEQISSALALYRATGSRSEEAIALGNFGRIYSESGEPRQALDHLVRALALSRATGHRAAEANALRYLGFVYDLLGEKQKALDHWEQALLLRRASGDRRAESNELIWIGEIHGQSGRWQQALDCLGRALALCLEVGDRSGEARARSTLARVARDRGDLGEARAQIEAALRLGESLRAKTDQSELRTSYLAKVQGRYEFYIDLLMRLDRREPGAGHAAAALQASERARARTLLEALAEARAGIRQGVDPAILERERSLQQQLNAASRRLARLPGDKQGEEQAAAVKKEIATLLAQYQEVEGQIRARSPRYAALTQPALLSLREIQEQVLDADTLLLEYALGEERSYLWVVTRTEFAGYDLPPRAEVEAAARRVYELFSQSNSPADRLAAEAAALSHMLLGPAASRLGQLGPRRWLVVADGALQYIPFGALPAPAGDGRAAGPRPLIADREIVSLPSASTLAVLRRELAGRKPAPGSVAVLADPVFAPEDPRVKPGPGKQKGAAGGQDRRPEPASRSPLGMEKAAKESGITGFDRLRSTRREAEEIAALAGPGESLKALDFEASRATALGAALGRYRVVHIATHGLLDSQHPELSGLVLSLVDERGQPQDGFLRAHEVYNLELGADLVVLSGCQTALGKEVRGEGLLSLTRGFMYAGAPCVVASLWQVPEQATAALMKQFYRHMLVEGQKPAAALRAAQDELRRQPSWAAPYYWAAFILQGEWR